MEKKRLIIVSFIIAILVLIPLVYAYSYYDFESAANQIIDWIKSIFGPFFAALIGGNVDEYFFSRILLLILLYSIVFIVLKRIEIFKYNTFVCVLISAIVSILGVRYLSEIEFISFILVPYGAFAISAAVFLPFLIYFFFVETSVTSPIGRRMAWILFAAVFFGLWITRFGDIGKYNWVYGIGVGAVAISFVFDNQIQKYFGLHEIGKWRRKANEAEIARLQAEYQNIMNVDTPHARRRREDIVRKLKQLGADIAHT